MSLFSKKIKKSKTFNENSDFILLEGDCYENIKKLPDNSIKLIITSPPYNLNKEYECYNFGLISAKINSEFLLMQQILIENSPDIIVLNTGFNDLGAGYHGHKFEYYDDVNSLLKMGFEYDKNKSSFIYALDILLDSIINKYQLLKKGNLIQLGDSSKVFKEDYLN